MLLADHHDIVRAGPSDTLGLFGRKAFLRYTDHLGLFFRSDVVQANSPSQGAVFKLL